MEQYQLICSAHGGPGANARTLWALSVCLAAASLGLPNGGRSRSQAAFLSLVSHNSKLAAAPATQGQARLADGRPFCGQPAARDEPLAPEDGRAGER